MKSRFRGVTVEASSPALIEGTKSAVTDGQGRYRIVQLRPGVYKMRFSLTGFSEVIREGINLPSEFDATVNVQMKVGSLAETITVAGTMAQVDVQQATRTQVISRDVMDSLPIAGMPSTRSRGSAITRMTRTGLR